MCFEADRPAAHHHGRSAGLCGPWRPGADRPRLRSATGEPVRRTMTSSRLRALRRLTMRPTSRPAAALSRRSSSCSTGAARRASRIGVCTNKLEGLSVQLLEALDLLELFRRHRRARHDRHRQARSPLPIAKRSRADWAARIRAPSWSATARPTSRRRAPPACRSSGSPSAIRRRPVCGIRAGPADRAFRRAVAGDQRTPSHHLTSRAAARYTAAHPERAISSVGRALCSHRRGHWFEVQYRPPPVISRQVPRGKTLASECM